MHFLICITFYVLLASATLVGGADGPWVGTWELKRIIIPAQADQEKPVHRMILSKEGVYRTSVTPDIAPEIKYKIEVAKHDLQDFTFLIEIPDEGFGPAGIITIDGDVLSHTLQVSGGRTYIYRRISDMANMELMKNHEPATIVVEKQI